MKMFKKLMAVVLTGALAVSMLTGCAFGEAAKTAALVDQLNTKSLQGVTENKKDLTIKYERSNSLDDKADSLYNGKDNWNKDITKAALKTVTSVKIGSNNYYYYVVKVTEKSSELNKSKNWSAYAGGLHKAVMTAANAGNLKMSDVNNTDPQVAVTGKTKTQKVELGLKIVSKDDTRYAIVLFKAAA